MCGFPLVGNSPKARFHVIPCACIPSYVVAGGCGISQPCKLISLFGIGCVSHDIMYETRSKTLQVRRVPRSSK